MKKNKMKNIIIIILLLGLSTSFSINSFYKVKAKTYNFIVSITPTQVIINQNVTFQAIIRNTGESPLGSTTIAIPTELSIISQISILSPTNWNWTLNNSSIHLSALDGGVLLSQNENITLTFDVTTPSTPLVTNWNVEATTSIQGGGVSLTLEGEQPTLSVTSSTFVPPTIIISQDVINQGQTCYLSQYLAPSGGIPPYTFQWLESQNEELFTESLGTTHPEYAFSTSNQTSIGTWRFKLNVTDSSSIPQTVSSNVINVTINPELLAPSITTSANQVSQSQTLTLISSPLSTGTPPYSYQWYQKVPDQNYSMVGDDSSTFSFPGSTITGNWMFLLQVTDNTGTKINSTSIELNVYENYQFQPISSDFPLSNFILMVITVIPTSIIISIFIRRKSRKKENKKILKKDYDSTSKKVQTKANITFEKKENVIKSKNEKIETPEKNPKASCPKYFGYLHNRPKDSLLSIECLNCEKMQKCFENKS